MADVATTAKGWMNSAGTVTKYVLMAAGAAAGVGLLSGAFNFSTLAAPVTDLVAKASAGTVSTLSASAGATTSFAPIMTTAPALAPMTTTVAPSGAAAMISNIPAV